MRRADFPLGSEQSQLRHRETLDAESLKESSQQHSDDSKSRQDDRLEVEMKRAYRQLTTRRSAQQSRESTTFWSRSLDDMVIICHARRTSVRTRS